MLLLLLLHADGADNDGDDDGDDNDDGEDDDEDDDYDDLILSPDIVEVDQPVAPLKRRQLWS